MSTRLDLICHASTTATSRAAFADDEPLDDRGLAQASALAATMGHLRSGEATPAVHGPARRCAQTALALGVASRVDPDLDDWDLGRWRGRGLADVSAAHPGEVASWLGDPTAAPHGGHSLQQLLQRVAGWLDERAEHDGRLVAVTHAAVIRAAVVHALGAPPSAFWRLDVAPLTRATLTGAMGRWNLSLPLILPGGSGKAA